MKRGFSISITVGKNGGFYVHRHRICLWFMAVTWLPYDIDDIIREGLNVLEERHLRKQG